MFCIKFDQKNKKT